DSAMFTEMGQKVVIYGSNAQAYDMALWLTVHKKHVTIITPSKAEELDMQQSQHAKRMMSTALYALGVRAWPESTIVSAKEGKVTAKTTTGINHVFKCDAIVVCADMLPNTSLLAGIDLPETEVYAVGDCAAPFNIGKAIQAGNDAGRAV
ncbi:MAG: FAD-dependent oxidoreductase, partial [Lachnospiraceae bacterium]|nr:FAD-dependent oxidoreductase [Lachnospiraceae bacterium]